LTDAGILAVLTITTKRGVVLLLSSSLFVMIHSFDNLRTIAEKADKRESNPLKR